MWIVLEGIDGAGTTTQSALLARHLRGRGLDVHETAEPGEGEIGKLVRRALRREFAMQDGDRLPAEALALLFAADRIHHAKDEIEPAIRDGKWVVCDRYVHSSLAYQGNELPMDWVATINRRAPHPDLVLFLDVSVPVATERMNAREDEREIYEFEEFLEGVRSRYLGALRDGEIPYQRIDGEKGASEVFEDIKAIIEPLLLSA
jgi:dTMP kinase